VVYVVGSFGGCWTMIRFNFLFVIVHKLLIRCKPRWLTTSTLECIRCSRDTVTTSPSSTAPTCLTKSRSTMLTDLRYSTELQSIGLRCEDSICLKKRAIVRSSVQWWWPYSTASTSLEPKKYYARSRSARTEAECREDQ